MSRSSSTQSVKSSSSSSLHEDNVRDGVEMEASSKGKIKGSIVLHYFRAGANWFWIFVIFVLFVVSQILASAADYWVSVW